MKLSRNWKIVIGILTIAQLFIGLFFLVWFLSSLLPLIAAGNDAAIDSQFFASIGGIIVLIAFLTLLSFGVLVFYLIHAGTNRHITNTMKVVWIVLLLLFGSIVEVVYFFMEIVPEKSMTARLEQD
ncbi:MAG: hypothetical protein LC664_02510 [Flavobacteriales bacterium]|nr:hypothetical protein [Flavobacteriales bacterium]